MNELDYKPNSHRFREKQQEEKRVKKVVSGTVKTKKKGEMRKLADVFISEDVANVKSYVLLDVLVPAIKKAIVDIVENGINMILYGDTGRGRKRAGDYVSYNRFSDRDRRDDRRDSGARARFDYDDLVFESRSEVEAVREQMEDIIDTYGFVTVADLYEMADQQAPYTANKYGWTSIRTAEGIRARDGWMLKLPRAMPID